MTSVSSRRTSSNSAMAWILGGARCGGNSVGRVFEAQKGEYGPDYSRSILTLQRPRRFAATSTYAAGPERVWACKGCAAQGGPHPRQRASGCEWLTRADEAATACRTTRFKRSASCAVAPYHHRELMSNMTRIIGYAEKQRCRDVLCTYKRCFRDGSARYRGGAADGARIGICEWCRCPCLCTVRQRWCDPNVRSRVWWCGDDGPAMMSRAPSAGVRRQTGAAALVCRSCSWSRSVVVPISLRALLLPFPSCTAPALTQAPTAAASPLLHTVQLAESRMGAPHAAQRKRTGR
ncbi:hypothetical protein C8R45DRAFT_1001491 [Mycena sanguinolenta]|nr:hypothetical protein C8R45DRAFT_1001491 [Mycena sanguinolenta]